MNTNVNILFLYNLQQNVEEIVSEFIKQGFSIAYDSVNTCDEMLDRLNNNSYDFIVSEHNLSTTPVTEVLSLLSEKSVEIPLIVISDTYNENDMINTIKAGCRDYLVRGDISRLKTIVVRIICETERYNAKKEVQKQIQNQLIEEKKKLSTFFEAMPLGLVILDENMVVRCINSALTSHLGKSAESMINKKIGNSFSCVNSLRNRTGSGDEVHCKFCSLRDIVSEVNDTGIAVYGKEIQHSLFIEGKKEDVWFRVNSVPILIHGSKHVMLVIDDITENKRVEEALTKSRDFYLTLFENFPAFIWRSGLDKNCDYVNRSWLEFTGKTLEDELGNGWIANVHPDDLEGCFNTYTDAFNGQQSFNMEYRLRRHDGEYRWISDSGRPLYDTEGVFSGYIGSCYDITEKKQELELLSKYQLLSKHTNDIIIFIDPKGKILEINEAGLRKYGYSREEFKTITLSDLRKVDGISIINEHLDKVWTQSIMFDTTHFRKDGSSFPVEISWSGAEIGDKHKILCVVRDITERKKLQINLEERNKELQDVVERLKQTQSQLVQQEQFAAIGVLAAGVAHEINNPLGFVISNIETLEKYGSRLKEVAMGFGKLKETVNFEEVKRILAEIGEMERRYSVDAIKSDIEALVNETKEGLHRISKIVTGLRVFSRVDNLDQLIDYDLNEGIENSLMVANNEIKYHADIEKNLGDISSIALPGNQINQVLLNIIINAAHAIRDKQGEKRGLIKLSTYEDKGFVCCDIEDNGIGVTEENLNKIFNPFFTTKPIGQGTGLGLSISYDIIVNKYGGEMTVKSTPDIGTVFTIKLPTR